MLILQTLANAEIKELFLPVSRPEVAKIRQKFQILFCKMLKNKSYHEKVSCEWSHHRDLVCYIRLFFFMIHSESEANTFNSAIHVE